MSQKAEKKLNPMTLMDETCKINFGCDIAEATKMQVYQSLCMVVRDILSQKSSAFKKKTSKNEDKQVFYMSMEFLVGTSLKNWI